ncbi:MAG: hypothetical protein QOH06_1197 [Acidobacteriota bacterium]|jgi:hypothetical protein|nr:hypothetical protein [Acidobacteriota bacterium]
MKIFLKSLAALLFLALSIWAIRSDSVEESVNVVNAEPLPVSGGDASWRRDGLWDDGKAEFCAYDVLWSRYGHHYDGRALLILVKEPWNDKLDVKADDPAASRFDVLKLNHVRDVPTGIYTYHQMASVYLRRDTGGLQKLAATSSEACGVSTAEVVRGRLDTRSYFDSQGDRSLDYPVGAIPEDGLPAALRDFVEGEAPATLHVFPSLMQSRFPELAAAEWRVEKRAVEEGMQIQLQREGSSLAYTFERQPPHRLLRFETGDGTVYKMKKCERLAYWEMHGPGDEAWLPAGVR